MNLIHRISHSLWFWQVMFFGMFVLTVICYATQPRIVVKEKVILVIGGPVLSDSYESEVM